VDVRLNQQRNTAKPFTVSCLILDTRPSPAKAGVIKKGLRPPSVRGFPWALLIALQSHHSAAPKRFI
jgi:hypothetical protein